MILEGNFQDFFKEYTMSKSFRNQISTIASLDGFTNMLIDLIKQDQIILKNADGSENKEDPEWVTPLKESLLQVKKSSRLAQLECKGLITNDDMKRIHKAINDSTQYFLVGGSDKIMDIVSFISFSLIGLDDVTQCLKGVKKKLRNNAKIQAFEKLAIDGFAVVQFFDPDLDKIDSYTKAEYARKRWNIIFEI
jgi:hypothetical protein